MPQLHCANALTHLATSCHTPTQVMRPVIGATILGGGLIIMLCARSAAKATIPPGAKVRGSARSVRVVEHVLRGVSGGAGCSIIFIVLWWDCCSIYYFGKVWNFKVNTLELCYLLTTTCT